MQELAGDATDQAVLETLAGMNCSFCERGELAADTFKGDEAVVCTECGVPGARVW